MKLVEALPFAFIAVVAAAALAMDDKPAYEGPPAPEKRPVMSQAKWYPAEEAVPANETVVPPEEPKAAAAPVPPPASKPKPAPARKDKSLNVAERADKPRQRIEVEGRRLSPDERIQRAAMNAIARVPYITGQIGVEAKDKVVRLSGWTLTPGQALRAEKTVARLEGVRSVVNEIRPRMGVMTS